MEKKIVLRIFEIVGSEFCVSANDGQKVYDQLALALKKNLQVQVSFVNITRLTSAFLNVAIGQLYSEFSSKLIQSNLSVIDMDINDRELLNRVIKTAKIYFEDPARFDKVRNNILGEEADDSN